MKTSNRIRFVVGMMLWLVLAQGEVRSATLRVFAAASLTDCLKEIASRYERQTGDKVVLNFGSSGLLARQIREGAPADVFFSADEAQMESLRQAGMVLAATHTNLLSNSLVIVVAREGGEEISGAEDLLKVAIKRIALADTRTVPAGIYVRQYLERKKLWSAIERKVVPMENVRAALAAVESGNVEAGMVYKTDALNSKKVKTVYEVPAGEGPRIRYPVAVMKESKAMESATRFVQLLASLEGVTSFRKFGFIVAE